MKDCPALPGKTGIIGRRKQGFKMQGKQGGLHILGILGPCIFYISEIRAGRSCENERKEVRKDGKETEPGAGPELEKIHRKRRENDAR